MGKKQHAKDRLYLTTKEWREEWGGAKSAGSVQLTKLPFQCCAITFTAFEDPVCTADGSVFDVVNAVPYVQKYHRHPVTGEPLELKDLIPLKFHKNAEGVYHCPVMDKVFTEHTHIVAVKNTGNVYCYKAVDELNIKPKNWKDLLTEEPFNRKDIIHIQDPLKLKDVREFDHIRKNLIIDEKEKDGKKDMFRNISDDTKRALETLNTPASQAAFQAGGGGSQAQARQLLAEATAKEKASKEGNSGKGAKTGQGDWRLQPPERKKLMPMKPGASTWDTDDYTKPESKSKKRKRTSVAQAGDAEKPAKSGKPTPKEQYEKHVKYVEAHETTGAMSRAFTSTVMASTTKSERRLIRLDRNPKKKGYLRMHTSLGDLNIELHCDIVPRTCENFLGLCDMGYYAGVVFHRSIKNFMAQGGDPSGTGKGGESIYGPTFQDELDSRLTHSGRGVLSMANSGPHTNGSQFFILYKSAHHLDFKHTVFGKVVGGLDTLTAMEKVATDDGDRPLQAITITGVTIFTNPYQEMEDQEGKEKEDEEHKAKQLEEDDRKGLWFSDPGRQARLDKMKSLEDLKTGGSGVGRYLKVPASSSRLGQAQDQNQGTNESDTGKELGSESRHGSQGVPEPRKKSDNGYGNFDAW